MIKKFVTIVTTSFSLLLLTTTAAFAHVAVKPNTAGVAQYQTFTVAVPNEKAISTTGVRLVIPQGLESVMPNVKPGWKIDIKHQGEGTDTPVTEIIWSNGTIPAGQRDEFLFSAKVPAQETTLQWKAYQTYDDGTVVSWDQTPSANDHEEAENTGPYSETKVINDLTGQASSSAQLPKMTPDVASASTKTLAALALVISMLSLLLSINHIRRKIK